jgi:hypothetical protein
MKATPEIILKCLSRHHELTEDDRQDLAVQLWSKSHQYDESIATVSAWVSASVKNYLISKSRQKKKVNDLTIPISFFETTNSENNHINNAVSDLLASEELSPDEQLITSENREVSLNRLKMTLNQSEMEFVQDILDGKVNFSSQENSTNRVRFKRLLEKIAAGPQKCKFILRDISTGDEFQYDTYKEIVKHTGFTHETVSSSFKANKIFGKKWKIFTQ